MKSFLELVVEDLLDQTHQEMDGMIIVFPNRRAGRLFTKQLARLIERPIWSPQVYSLDDWIISLSGLSKIDLDQALFFLYRAYIRVTGSNQTPSSFLDWGEMVLSDFEDVDKYLANPKSLFQNLSQLHEIESRFPSMEPEELELITQFWKTFQPRPSVHQAQWLSLWEKLFAIYTRFHEDLYAEGLGTAGMCYRRAVGLLNEERGLLSKVNRVVFVGFNALSRAEEVLFRFCQEMKQALFYWDFDPWFIDDKRECGAFIKKYIGYFPPPDSFTERYRLSGTNFSLSTPQTIRVISVNSQSAQYQLLIRDIKENPLIDIETGHLLPRGIVTPDENSMCDILPLWNSNLGELNITMGWPVKKTDISDYLRLWFQVFRNSDWSKPDGRLHRPSIILVIRHNYSKTLDTEGFMDLQSLIKSKGSDWIMVDQLPQNHLFRSFLFQASDKYHILDRLQILLDSLHQVNPALSNLNRQSLTKFEMWLDNLKKLCEKFSIQPDIDFAYKMMNRFINGDRITLDSSVESPNHLSGILETRLLDFKHLYILSLNEGLWPSKAMAPSLIPFSIRKVWSLPTAEHRDGMYSYYFYRLLLKAHRITLFYISAQKDDSGQSGEKSRYITQLQYASPFKLSMFHEQSFVMSPGPRVIEVPKSKELLEHLVGPNSLLKGINELSPSALNMLIDCGLKYALHYGYKVREPRGSESIDDPRIFGTIFHQALEEIYKPVKGTGIPITNEFFEEQLKHPEIIRSRISKAVEKEGYLINKSNPDGLSAIILEMLFHYTTGVLQFDLQHTPFSIIQLEEKLSLELEISLAGKITPIRFMGIVDRLDLRNDQWVVIDYKTGKVKLNVKTMDELFDSKKDNRPSELLQLMLYCEFVYQKNSGERPIQAGLYEVRRIRAGNPEFLMTLNNETFNYLEHRDSFLSMLKTHLEYLLDSRESFSQTSNEKICSRCSFNILCRRHQ